MPSQAYRQWQHVRTREMDQLESAHTLLGGTARGRRYTTQQINRAYAVLLASQFQGFARDLHTESVDALRLAQVQRWRRGCHHLARSLDIFLRSYIQSVTGSNPW